MKKAISVLLAVVLSVSQLALCAEAASNPLQASDRITQQLADTASRKQEIENARIQRANMKNAAVTYGATSKDTNNLGFILNRKTMTKREFEAFKWSFILSQFAVPLEDSLVDVFSQNLFNQMIEKNMDISAVQDALQYGGANPDDIKVMSSMLQDINFNDIVDTIKDNYSLLYLYRENDTALTLADLLYGGPAINERFYVYDTIIVPGSGVSTDELNALYYQQDKLADASKLPEYSIGTQKIPVAVYDASFYFYLQLAVGTYCLHNSTSVAALEELCGTAQIVIDSYGNICAYTAGSAKILMPNFGNSLFVNIDGGDVLKYHSAIGQINMYNKWVTTLYTRTQRTHVGSTTSSSDIFGGFSPIALGGASTYTRDDESMSSTENTQAIAGQYISELVVKDGSGDLSNTMILVDPADITVLGGLVENYLEDYLSDEGTRCFSPVHNKGAISDMNVRYPYTNRKSNIYTRVASTLHRTFYTRAEDTNDVEGQFLWWTWSKNDKWKDQVYNTYEGTLYSNINKAGTNYVFTHALQDLSALADNEAFFNPYPVINTGVNLASLDTTSNSGKTHYYKVAMSLLKGSWRYAITADDNTRTEQTVYSGTEGANKAQEFLQAINNCLVMVTTFNSDQIVRDLRFASDRASKQDNGNEYSEIYLPISVINIGQNCSAFVGDEKGMFVTKHQDYFSSSMKSFRELLKSYLKDITGMANNGDGGAVKNGGLNFSVEYADDGKGILELQSTKVKEDKSWFDWDSVPTNYNEGLIVALETQPKDLVNNVPAWTSTEVEINKQYYQSFDDLDAYLSRVRRALNNADEMYFSIGLCTGKNSYKGEDGKETIDEKHTDKNNMRATPNGLKFEVRYSNGTSWKINWWRYDATGTEAARGDFTVANTTIEYDADGEKYKETVWLESGHKAAVGENSDELNLFTDKMGADETQSASIVTLMNFMAACGETYKILDEGEDVSIASFKASLAGVCSKYGFDTDQFLYAMAMLQHGAIDDKVNNIVTDVYFFDEYQYLLRDTQAASGEPGSVNSLDFAAITYYWDRAYLPEMVFNTTMVNQIYTMLGATSVDTAAMNSPYLRWISYEAYLGENGVTKIQYPFKQYLKDCYQNEGLDLPFTQELCLQTQSLADYIETNSTIQQYFNFNTQVYNYLNLDTIVAYPVIESNRIPVIVSNGLADVVAVRGSVDTTEEIRDALETSNIVFAHDPLRLIMALQANTDYEHNYLIASPAKAPEVQHVSKEELMDKANIFFDNPVSSLSYILAGFLYKAHTAVATGSLGSVFSANWLVESSVYKWIMARYIAIVTIIVVVLLAIKLTQFAMSKTRDYGSVGRAVVGILAMCMVPLLVFNSFIWAFDKTSQWALAGPTNKMLLSEVNSAVLNRVNNDPGVTAEFNAFREQFDGISGEYDGLTFEELEDYSLDGPVYRQVPLTSYTLYLQFGTDKKNWFSDEGYIPVNISHYDESMFYYFYDYIRSEFFNYVSTNANQSMPSSTYLTVLNECRPYLADSYKGDEKQKDAWIKITSAEAGLAEQTGEFISMLRDTDFVYSLSINPQLSDRYGGAYAKDLAGVYTLFDSKVNNDYTGTIDTTDTWGAVHSVIKNSAWRRAMNDAKIMAYNDSINPKLWTDNSVITEFLDEQNQLGNHRALGQNTTIFTSRLDAFDSSSNGDSYWVDARYNNLALTPLEEKLCSVTTSIYEDTLKALEYHEAEIKNEAAIQLMAWIATFRVSEAFGLEPSGPIPQTVTLDTVVRTSFIRDLNTISSNSNTMYTMVAQGDSVGKLALVLLLETAIAIAGVLRIFIILYLTGASFVIFALRLLHKAPQTTDLMYGIVGNVMALLALHALTLFLVVISVEWIAKFTSNIPGLVLDLVMIAFVILMCRFLYHLVKNLVQDAVNLGGAKIKAGVHNMVGKIANVITHAANIDSLATQLDGTDVSLNADNVAEQIEQSDQLLNEQSQRSRARVERTVNILREVETEEALQEERHQETPLADSTDSTIARNSTIERDISSNN